MPDPTYSKLAVDVRELDAYGPRLLPRTHPEARLRKPWGFCLHTTGSGVPSRAVAKGIKPIDVALDIYVRSQRGQLHDYKWGGPGYVIDYDGTIYQLAPDDIVTYHCGGDDRAAYLDGSWVSKCAPEAVAQWRKKWPGKRSPQSLYPSKSANFDYIGAEMIPVTGTGEKPWRPGLLFTQRQHEAAVALAQDLAARHGWPSGWAATARLVGHEDVQLLERHNKGGGWDPGWLRDKPFFDFDYVRTWSST